MKNGIKFFLQTILGIENYLLIFSLFVIGKLKYDRKEKDFLYFLSLLPDGETLLDIGANIGVMTVHMARRFPKSTVYSFEPLPLNLSILKKIVRLFALKNVIVREIALGDHEGEVTMILPMEKSVMLHGLSHVKHPSIGSLNAGEEFSVEMKMLDDLKDLKSCHITGIKLDVENFEYFVLSGAEKIIKRCRPVIYCELWDNLNRVKTFEFLQELGYKIQVREKNGLVSFDASRHTTQNFFFIPE